MKRVIAPTQERAMSTGSKHFIFYGYHNKHQSEILLFSCLALRSQSGGVNSVIKKDTSPKILTKTFSDSRSHRHLDTMPSMWSSMHLLCMNPYHSPPTEDFFVLLFFQIFFLQFLLKLEGSCMLFLVFLSFPLVSCFLSRNCFFVVNPISL